MSTSKPPLHWPAWVWVMGHFILFAFLLFCFCVFLLGEILPLVAESAETEGFFYPGQSLISVLYTVVLYFVYLPVCLTAGITMLINRKMGWKFTFITLFLSTLYFTLVWLKQFYYYSQPTEHDRIIRIAWLSRSLFAYGVNVAWLIYFILARRRYGIGLKAEG